MKNGRDREWQMFGQPVEQMQMTYDRFKNDAEIMLYVLSLISDAQESAAFGMTDASRRILNEAKWFLDMAARKQG